MISFSPSHQLIGLVALEIIRKHLEHHVNNNTNGMIRFDSFDSNVLAVCFNTMASEASSAGSTLADIELRLSRTLVDESEIVDTSILTDKSPAAIRNESCDARLKLFANSSDDIASDTLRDVASLTEYDLLDDASAWIAALTVTRPQLAQSAVKAQLGAMFGAFSSVMRRNLIVSAELLLAVTDEVIEGSTIEHALNENLRLLGYPRYIGAMPKTLDADSVSAWQVAFKQIKELPIHLFGSKDRPYDISLSDLQERLEGLKQWSLPAASLEIYESLAVNDGQHAWLDLLNLDWENDGLCEFVTTTKVKAKPQSLSEQTIEYLEQNQHQALKWKIPETNATVRDFLEGLGKTKKLEGEELDTARRFYALVGLYLAQNNPALDRRWDKLLFSEIIEGPDFVESVLKAAKLLNERVDVTKLKDPVLLLRGRTRRPTLCGTTNYELLTYFSLVYRGLETQCGNFIAFRFKHFNLNSMNQLNPLFHYEVIENYAAKKIKGRRAKAKSDSLSKEALMLDFDAYIIERDLLDQDQDQELATEKAVRIVWQLSKTSVALHLARDWQTLLKEKQRSKPAYSVIYARNFKQTNSKGLISELTLEDSASFGLTTPGFVYRNRPNLTDMKALFEDVLSRAPANVNVAAIERAWATFKDAYDTAINDVMRIGFGAASIADMHETYGELLKTISDNANRSQQFRQDALSYLLSIGVFSFVDHISAYAITMPWHPLRLYALHTAFVTNTGLIKLFVTGEGGVPKPSSEVLVQLHAHSQKLEPFYVVVPKNTGLDSEKKRCEEILAPVEECSGYTLYARVAGKACRDNGTDVAAAKELTDIAVNSYLNYVPQASNCLRVILPDVVSKQFPTQFIHEMLEYHQKLSVTVGGLNAENYLVENEDTLYQGLISETALSKSLEEATLASRSMKSSVQVSVSIANKSLLAMGPNGKDHIAPFDIAFVDRFFTYSADVTWIELPKRVDVATPYNLTTRLQLRSPRLVQLENEFTSTTLLCGDAVDAVGHAYINATSWLIESRSAISEDSFAYPCLQVDCNNSAVANNIRALHQLANWVVTINDFIDRRQLINENIKIVRYKTNPKTGKTSIISSEMPTGILSERVANRIKSLHTGLLRNSCGAIASRILEASYRISGYVALRAAKRDVNANEVIGLVLSNWFAQTAMIKQAKEQGEKVLAAVSYLLDDYAAVFKNRNSRADLLCIVLAQKNGRRIVHLTMTEAKFCGESILYEEKLKSANQLAASFDVLFDALNDSDGARADRPIWLARLADMITSLSKADLIEQSLSSKELIAFSDAVKAGDFDITLAGASHVFAYDAKSPLDISDLHHSSGSRALSQFIFGAEATAFALEAFNGTKPTEAVVDALAHDLLVPLNLVQPWDWSSKLDIPYLGQAIQPRTVLDVAKSRLQSYGGDPVERAQKPVESQPSPISTESAVAPPDLQPVIEATPIATTVEATPQSVTIPSVDALAPFSHKQCISTDGRTFAPAFERVVRSKAADTEYSPERLAWAEQATQALQLTLSSRGITAKVKRFDLTPNGCLVSFEGHPDLTTKSILALRETLLTTQAINIVFVQPQPGRMLVLFNDGSDNRETVSMWTIWNRRKVEKRSAGVNLSFVVGLKETDAQILYLDPIKHDPHTLIAGRTGSGKTVLMQTMILDMAATNPSTKLKFYIIDPKGGNDYFSLLRLPHLAAPLIRDQDEAVQLLGQLVEEMHRRNALFQKVRVNKLDLYNRKVPPEEQLPVLFVIHDELPQWMANKDYRQTVTETLTQLATMSRASGIYLIFLAQRPDKDVMSMQVRSNLGNRLVLKVDAATAEIALGEKGAENLLGKGHLAAMLGGKLQYAQAPYLDESLGEVDEAVDAIIAGDAEWAESPRPEAEPNGEAPAPVIPDAATVEFQTPVELPRSVEPPRTHPQAAPASIMELHPELKSDAEPDHQLVQEPVQIVCATTPAPAVPPTVAPVLAKAMMRPLDSIDEKQISFLQSGKMDLQIYIERAYARNSKKMRDLPIWCLALYENQTYRYWWRRVGSEPAYPTPPGDRRYILGLIALGASIRYYDLTGQDRPGNNAFVANLQDDIVVDGVSIKTICQARAFKDQPSDDYIHAKGAEVEAFVAAENANPKSQYRKPNAVGRLKEIALRNQKDYTIKL